MYSPSPTKVRIINLCGGGEKKPLQGNQRGKKRELARFDIHHTHRHADGGLKCILDGSFSAGASLPATPQPRHQTRNAAGGSCGRRGTGRRRKLALSAGPGMSGLGIGKGVGRRGGELLRGVRLGGAGGGLVDGRRGDGVHLVLGGRGLVGIVAGLGVGVARVETGAVGASDEPLEGGKLC